MPTLSNDVQAVLATDKVRFQGQEVAFVVAEDRYSARDALELIDVEYDVARPGRSTPARRSTPDAPVIRDDLEGKTTTTASTGRPATRRPPRRCSPRPTSWSRQDIVYPRVHPAPMETCGAVADFDRGRRQADAVVDHPGAARAPHALRDRRRPARAQDPGDLAGHRRRLRQQGADLSRLRVRDRRLDRDRQAGEVDGGPRRRT